MPPERLRFDRKDFFKEREHNNNNRSSDSLVGGSGGNGGGSLARWRDYHSSSSHHSHSREFARWGSPDFRRPPGHGKQGGWHLFAEDSGNVYSPSRSSDKIPEDDNTRISVPRGDRKYGRNSKENRSSFGQRDGRGHAWNTSNRYATTPGRLHNVNCDQRSVDMLTYPFHPQSDFVNTWDHLQLKDQHDNKIGGVNGLGTDQRCERENSLDWKINWTRSGSFSSRGSGLSHLSSWKSMGGIDSSEGKANLQPKNATPVRSSSGDAATYVTSGALSEETSSKKKLRLGWGEGLANYEKKKVEVPDASVSKDVVFNSSCNTEPLQSLSSNLAEIPENSLKVVGFLDCASPATPPSVSCSSSPGVEEKAFGKPVSVENDGSNLCGSPSIGSQNHLEGFLLNFEKLDNDSIGNLGSSLVEFLQCDDPSLVGSSFARSTAMNKFLVWKGDVLKTLETTESEIDSLENELKILKSSLGNTSPCPASSTSLSLEDYANQFNEQGIVSNSMARPAPSQIDCGDVTVEEMPDCSCGLEELHADGKDEDINIPGTATSKFVEPSSFVKPLSPSDMIKNGESFRILDAIHGTNTEVKCIVPGSLGERTAGVHTCGDGGILIDSKNNAPVSSDCCAYPNGENTLCDIILGANKELANEASEVFNKLLPRGHSKIDIAGVANVFCDENDSLIKEKFAKRKYFIRFKERVLTCKFKAFQHLWKEDLHLLSIRKYCAMSQKKCELSSRTTFTGYQKHRPSIRPQFSSPVGNLSPVPTTGVINFTSNLLSDFQIKVYRDSLKMPALILDEKEKIVSRFILSNGLVEDPCAVEKERAMINPWNAEEREIFLDKLATFGKDFRKIASFLDYKTTADCVEFYYKNHKSDCFQKLKKKQDFCKQGKTSANKYLVTSGKRNRRMNAASLDILGEASQIAASAQSDSCRLINSGRISSGGQHDSRTSLGNDGIVERSSRLDVLGSESETAAAADVLVGICGSLSSEAINSCVTSALGPGKGQWDWKHQKVDSVMRLPSTSDVTQNVDDDTCSDESCGEMDPSDWTDEEKSIFLQAVSSYGKDFYMIAGCVRTRSRDQCKAFFSKARKCLGLDLIHTRRGNVRTSVNDDANGGGSDSKDACVLETSTVICCDKLGCKMDEDLPAHELNNQDESLPSGATNLQTDLIKCGDDSGMALLDDKDSEAVKPLIYDARKSESRSFELESNSINGMDNQSEWVLDQKNAVVLFKTAVRDKVAEQGTGSVTAGEAIDPCPSSSNAVEERNDVVAEASTKGFGSGLHELMLPDEQDKNCNVDASGENEILQDSNTTGIAFDYVDTSLRSVSSMLDSVDKPPVVSLLQENSLPAATSIPHDSLAIQCEKTFNQDRLSSTLNLQKSKDERFHKSVGGNDYLKHLSGHSVVNHVEYQIFNGHPLPISPKKEMNGDINCRQLSEVQSISKSDRNIDGPCLAQDCYLWKCNSSMPHPSISELPSLPQNIEQRRDCPRAHSCSLSDTEKPCKNGDVKLFGKILSHPSSPQKTFSSHENGEKGHHHKQSNKASNLEFSAPHPADGSGALLNFDRNNYVGLENVPVRSCYGFWDGNRIQTGFSSLPDSAIMLTKYPAAFSCPAASSKLEQQSLQAAVVKSNECNLNGVPVFSPREISSSNGVVDYQVYRSRGGTKMQPFSVDMKQRQEFLFSEMQRRNGFEAHSSLQQHGKGKAGVNVVGRMVGGILVRGGSCTGVSDPVAAIRMHYAKGEQCGGQGGLSSEKMSRGGEGDIDR